MSCSAPRSRGVRASRRFLQPRELHVSVAAPVGDLGQIAQSVAILAAGAPLELGPEGAQPATHAAQRDAQIVQPFEVVRIRRQVIRFAASPVEALERDQSRAANG